ncbi:MAG: hypothetical protein ACR2NR_14155 [Solirubrobacteraceae bacterium]
MSIAAFADALAPVHQQYLLEARQMQALSFAVHIPLNPVSVLVGLLAVTFSAYLAAVYLAADAARADDPSLPRTTPWSRWWWLCWPVGRSCSRRSGCCSR